MVDPWLAVQLLAVTTTAAAATCVSGPYAAMPARPVNSSAVVTYAVEAIYRIWFQQYQPHLQWLLTPCLAPASQYWPVFTKFVKPTAQAHQ